MAASLVSVVLELPTLGKKRQKENKRSSQFPVNETKSSSMQRPAGQTMVFRER
jgi:hypothetical protein